jgi:ABC-2 type transport system permease protein
MRMKAFAIRNAKEIVRDPLNLCFGIGFPLVLILLLSAIQANIPVPLFEIQHLTPGVTVFGLSFITLFSATIISKDRTSSFLQRLYTTPMTPMDFILGYTLPIIPISMVQAVICYTVAIFLGMEPTVNILYAIITLIPACFLYIGLGLLFGSILNDKQVGGICGALLTNLSAWLSGIWFVLELVGKAFKTVAYSLPFAHAVELERLAVAGDFGEIWTHLLVVLAYSIGSMALAVYFFLRQMKNNCF